MKLFLLLSIIVTAIHGLSCNVGRVGCVASCQIQNCATGYCDQSLCRCSRCSHGQPPKGLFR